MRLKILINGKEGKAMADQLMTVSDLRFIDKIGKVSSEEMERIEQIIEIQLALKRK